MIDNKIAAAAIHSGKEETRFYFFLIPWPECYVKWHKKESLLTSIYNNLDIV